MIDYKNTSLANQVFAAIEKNILTGVYPAGEPISEPRLSAELGVSRTPIREAITRLEAERLIKQTSSGMIVVGISKKDVEEMLKKSKIWTRNFTILFIARVPVRHSNPFFPRCTTN